LKQGKHYITKGYKVKKLLILIFGLVALGQAENYDLPATKKGSYQCVLKQVTIDNKRDNTLIDNYNKKATLIIKDKTTNLKFEDISYPYRFVMAQDTGREIVDVYVYEKDKQLQLIIDRKVNALGKTTVIQKAHHRMNFYVCDR